MREPTPFGPWLLLDRIAVGGMAEVMLAVRAGERPPRPYALKRMLPMLAEDPELVTMFLDEARVWAQLAHTSILPVRELGREDGVYYIAYDYLPGRDLRALLQRLAARGERFPVPVAVHVAARVADALDHAHRRRGARGEALRVVHNDVSPGNVLLGFDGSVRVIDFGIAQAQLREAVTALAAERAQGQAEEPGPARQRAPAAGRGHAAGPDLERAGGVGERGLPPCRGGEPRTPPPRSTSTLRGKFAYLSPEAVEGLPVDRRADVFSLGVVLHEMLTGERLFASRSELATLAELRSRDVPPPSLRRSEVPAGLDAVVLRALARDRERRFRWAGDLRDALAPYAAEEGGPALARLLAGAFPAELRAELTRLEELRGPEAERRSGDGEAPRERPREAAPIPCASSPARARAR